MTRFLLALARRAAVGVALAVFLLLAPLPELAGAWEPLRLGAGSLLFLLAIGKALYDTFFYDHYWP
jgi:hypothetical protein